ncbi:2,3-bisphosphoglycerate-independent phosphoglycerate mutase [Chloroflexota bacterium]
METTNLDLIKEISKTSSAKILMLVIDGLGGLPHPNSGRTELETTYTPNLDELAAKSICGMSLPVGPGITPGSAPGHLSLFGYDPLAFRIGRGTLEALGIDFELESGDVAARGNFCTFDENGLISDRRAGRIPTRQSSELCQLLDGIEISGVKIIVRPVKDHRFIAVFRGDNLNADISDSDPQQAMAAPKVVIATNRQSDFFAGIVNQFLKKAEGILADCQPANMILLRGFSKRPQFPSMRDVYKLKAAAIAGYPMYRGLAKVIGMRVLDTGETIEDEIETLKQNFNSHDFFFIHIKQTDTAGEDGDFNRKVTSLEYVDSTLPAILQLKPDVLVVCGDHSTPAILSGHSWHPVPVMLYSKYCRPDGVTQFSESAFQAGGLGRLNAVDIMPLAMANALKLGKFGA